MGMKQFVGNVEYSHEGNYQFFPIFNQMDINRNEYDTSLIDYDDIIIGWCNGKPYTEIRENEEEYETVKAVYLLCLNKAKQYIEEYYKDWLIGGTGIIVVVDIFPVELESDGTVELSQEVVIGFAEVQELPPKYYFKTFRIEHPDNNKIVREIIRKNVRPGSVLILNSFLYDIFKTGTTKKTYAKVVDVDMLANYNTFSQNIYDNINTIWDSVFAKCRNLGGFFDVENVLVSILWVQRFGADSYLKLVENTCSVEF